ncbi:MAG TPA: carbamoyltransferase C-terminal domain-containing protein [Thermoanaerobaculia bacterium]|nr:carbamoyltransferase C-terminal domain-containing protein [Thermoanaerobaculia bacterium]
MLVAGISAFYHESACCLLADGALVAAAAEERFSRLKHDAALPVEAWRFCLDRAGATPADVAAVGYYEQPVAKLARQLWAGPPPGDRELAWLDPSAPERAIRDRLGFDGPLLAFPHHLSHAASAFFYSGFDQAAVLTADGVGEWATTTYGRGAGSELDLFAEVRFPHSLGLFYSTLTAYLGFRVNSGEYKVMGLAPYGTPRLADRLRRVLRSGPGGGFALDPAYFDFLGGERMHSAALAELLGGPPRRRGEPVEAFHADVAASAQAVLEEVLLAKARWLHGETGAADLVMAGGVTLNCVAVGRIRREGPFRRVFVQPAAGDAGGSLGAAALAWRQLAGERPRHTAMRHVQHGPAWSGEEIAAMLAAAGLLAAPGQAPDDAAASTNGFGAERSDAGGGVRRPAQEHATRAAAVGPEEPAAAGVAAAMDFRGDPAALVEAAAERLAAGRIVGWFHGGMELGPRALGGRSILADPRDPEMRERLNRRVKRREPFRPFAPSVLAEAAAEHFDLPGPTAASPFMLETCRVTSPLALPAVTHVDGSARPQTVDRAVQPRYAALLDAFARRTGCPVLLNTSFNVADEPIVCTPADALFAFADAGLDSLVLEDFVLDREALPANLAALARVWRSDRHRPFGGERSLLGDHLYTFV